MQISDIQSAIKTITDYYILTLLTRKTNMLPKYHRPLIAPLQRTSTQAIDTHNNNRHAKIINFDLFDLSDNFDVRLTSN